MLVITCEASDTTFLTWRSNEYIGAGVSLEITFTTPVGRNISSDKVPTTFANLIATSSSPNSSFFDLESQLHIEVLANFTQFTVSCYNPGSDLQMNITFIVGKTLSRKI